MAETGRAPANQSLGVTNHRANSMSSNTGRSSPSSGAMPSITDAVGRSNWNSGNRGPQGLSSVTTARETTQRATNDTGKESGNHPATSQRWRINSARSSPLTRPPEPVKEAAVASQCSGTTALVRCV